MAQKVNPVSLRLQKTNRHFDSSWFNSSNYNGLLMREFKIKKYINSILNKVKFSSARFSIQNLHSKIKIYVFFCNFNENRAHMSKIFYLNNYKKTRKSRKNLLRKKHTITCSKHYKILNYLQNSPEVENFPNNISKFKNTYNGMRSVAMKEKNLQSIKYSNSINSFNQMYFRYFLIKYFALNTNNVCNNEKISADHAYKNKFMENNIVKLMQKQQFFFYTINFNFLKLQKKETFVTLQYNKLQNLFLKQLFLYKNNNLTGLGVDLPASRLCIKNDLKCSNNKLTQLRVNCSVHEIKTSYNSNLLVEKHGKMKLQLSKLCNCNNVHENFEFRNSLFFLNCLKNKICLQAGQFTNIKKFIAKLDSSQTNPLAASYITKQLAFNHIKYHNISNINNQYLNKTYDQYCNLYNYSAKRVKKSCFFKPELYSNFYKNIFSDANTSKSNYVPFQTALREHNQTFIQVGVTDKTSAQQPLPPEPAKGVLLPQHTKKLGFRCANSNGLEEKQILLSPRVKTLVYQVCKPEKTTRLHIPFALAYKPANSLGKLLMVNPPYKHHIESMIYSNILDAKMPINIQFFKTNNIFQNASFLIDEIIYYLEKKVPFFKLKNAILKKLTQQKLLPIKGIRVMCSGRVGGKSKKAQKAKIQNFKYGETSLHVFSSKIDFIAKNAFTSFGTLGIKVWICYQ